MARILVIDDEETLCEALRYNLEVEGYEADVAYSAEQAMGMHIESYDLLLLDVMMEGMDGFHLARELRKNPKTAQIPIIFCTAKDTEDDMVMGLNLGADDYISKPYSMRNMLARVRSVLRRGPHAPQEEAKKSTLTVEGLSLDTERKQCSVDGETVRLTKTEFEILSLFLGHPGRIFSRSDILAKIWTDDVVVCDRTVDVYITRLRKKIGKYGDYIITRSGYGYGFEK